jgi:hypothetical protein
MTRNGPDHVDAHRTIALAISPWTKRAYVDSTHYDTASMVATMEDMLHLPPMTIVDQRASRMWADFDNRPDLTPYDAKTPMVVPFGDPGYPTNPSTAPMAAQAAKWNVRGRSERVDLEVGQGAALRDAAAAARPHHRLAAQRRGGARRRRVGRSMAPIR